MHIRITVPILRHGSVQLGTQGQVVILPAELAQVYVDHQEAELVPEKEIATMPRPAQNTAMPRPRPTARPKPETRTPKRRSR